MDPRSNSTHRRQDSLARLKRPSTVIAAGLAYGLIEAGTLTLVESVWGGLFVFLLFFSQALVWVWWLLSPLASAAAWRLPLKGGGWWKNAFIHFVVSLAFAAATVVLFTPLMFVVTNYVYHPNPPGAGDDWVMTSLASLSYTLRPTIVAYWLIVTVAHVARQQENLAANEIELSRAQLESVRMQMSPHFLFNALHSVSALAASETPEKASGLIARLGNALRDSLAVRDEPTTTLENELDVLEDILEIEKVRFGDRLQVAITASDEALGTKVPRWLLQPLVENALVHGLAPNPAGGALRIAARLDGAAHLEVTVIDNGVGISARHEEGIGLGHTRRRLKALFDDRASLTLSAAPEGGTRATLRLPIERTKSVAA